MLIYDQLLDYTDWQRDRWRQWCGQQTETPLAVSVGPHGDGRMKTVGHVIRHMFSAEKLYIERLRGQPLTDTTKVSTDDLEALLAFGRASRAALREFIADLPVDQLDVPRELLIGDQLRVLTPRDILAHVVMHEIRHWAQLATILRLEGFAVEFHDFLRFADRR